MQFQDLPNLKEATKNIQITPPEFTIKPTGEVKVKGNPDPELMRQLLISTDYNQSANRDYNAAIAREQRVVDQMIIGFWGATFLVALICLFISFNKQQSQRANNGEFVQGTNCRQIQQVGR